MAWRMRCSRTGEGSSPMTFVPSTIAASACITSDSLANVQMLVAVAAIKIVCTRESMIKIRFHLFLNTSRFHLLVCLFSIFFHYTTYLTNKQLKIKCPSFLHKRFSQNEKTSAAAEVSFIDLRQSCISYVKLRSCWKQRRFPWRLLVKSRRSPSCP